MNTFVFFRVPTAKSGPCRGFAGPFAPAPQQNKTKQKRVTLDGERNETQRDKTVPVARLPFSSYAPLWKKAMKNHEKT